MSIVRKQKTPSVPLKGHQHTCRACSHRHKWLCSSETCTWNLFLTCAAGRNRAASAPRSNLRG